ncbi:hypothetical protein BX600DRAFT_144252 [Xylariales sp. PMI_506]|nr:hypothetical protein BX600DRAFT_144252 [Xylariales sp. PMI_506]
MARLNEPMVATESIDTLRRRFLRQNRDIARINSSQSLRIRNLENEYARMLSENLDLRGQILRLETELRESRAHRIADHALELKEKMEAQLLQWGTMLASLGHEPTPRMTSPRAAKKPRIRPSMTIADSPRWRRRTTLELESAALQEGRLAPLWEDKPCPRQSLNGAEILALRSEEAETTESPDLGPPPVSRFVNNDPVKLDLSIKAPSAAPTTSSVCEAKSKTLSKDSRREERMEPMSAKKEANSPKKEKIITKKAQSTLAALRPTPDSEITDQAIKANLKRKSREDEEKENEGFSTSKGLYMKPAKSQLDKLSKDRPINRPLKAVSIKKNVPETSPALTVSTAPRKPLAVRSSNEPVNTPNKSTKAQLLDEIARAKAEVKSKEQAKDKAKPKKSAVPVAAEIPAPKPSVPVPITTIDMEAESLSEETHLSAPNSPEASVPGEEMRDTPPPADISEKGETSRPSRRNRGTVSYAEPNLRDKMRRPTKQLFDAVAGEGKSMRRISQSKPSDLPSVKSEEKAEGWKATGHQASDHAAASPLAQKVLRVESSDPEATIMTLDKRKRNSSVLGHPIESDNASTTMGKITSAKLAARRLDETKARESEGTKSFDQADDVYEFNDSSPHSPKISALEETTKKINNSRQGKSRRLSSMMREDFTSATEGTDAQTHDRASTTKGQRKRASMIVQKTTSKSDMLEDGSADSSLNSLDSADGDGSRVSTRRRSMMI